MQVKKRIFGELFNDLRERNGFTQDSLAQDIGVSRQSIVAAVSGKKVPKANFIYEAYRLFRSRELLEKYLLIQRNKKELTTLAEWLGMENFTISFRIYKEIIRISLETNDMQTIFATMIKMIMINMKEGKKVNQRKVDLLVEIARISDIDPDFFYQLTYDLYHVARETENLATYLNITEPILKSVKLDNRKLSYLLLHQAATYYFLQDYNTAYKRSEKAIEAMDGEIFSHSAYIYHRHSLICMQIPDKSFYKEALDASLKSLSLVSKRDTLYGNIKAELARIYYMNKKFDEARVYWDEVLKTYKELDPERTHTLNDIIMAEIMLGNLHEAKNRITECERILERSKMWRYYNTEEMLLRRGKAMLKATELNNFNISDVSVILQEMSNRHPQDEFHVTKNFVLERTFL